MSEVIISQPLLHGLVWWNHFSGLLTNFHPEMTTKYWSNPVSCLSIHTIPLMIAFSPKLNDSQLSISSPSSLLYFNCLNTLAEWCLPPLSTWVFQALDKHGQKSCQLSSPALSSTRLPFSRCSFPIQGPSIQPSAMIKSVWFLFSHLQSKGPLSWIS